MVGGASSAEPTAAISCDRSHHNPMGLENPANSGGSDVARTWCEGGERAGDEASKVGHKELVRDLEAWVQVGTSFCRW